MIEDRRPSRRRPRRSDEVTYRVRIDLKDAKPPIWRRLDVSSHLPLDEVHEIIQTAFEWTDSHLHRFALGTSVWDLDAESFLCPYDVEDGDTDGVPAHDVRLDEVLVDVGDRLLYVYDYGDSWEHVVRLEAIYDRTGDQPTAMCVDGRRAGPPEDCGGIWGYSELVASGDVDGDDFDIEEINESLTTTRTAAALARGPVRRLLAMTWIGDPINDDLHALVDAAHLRDSVEIDAEGASHMVRHYVWLLDRVGNDGLKLTSVGYLRPVDVEAAFVELQLSDRWIGKGNREDHTVPVRELRTSAQALGLVRKYRGSLQCTAQGRMLRDDSLRLWWHIVGRFPMGKRDSIEEHASIVSLLGVAAGRDVRSVDFERVLDGVLGALGWRTETGAPLEPGAGTSAASATNRLLGQLDVFAAERSYSSPVIPTSNGRQFARAILQRE